MHDFHENEKVGMLCIKIEEGCIKCNKINNYALPQWLFFAMKI